MSPWWRRPPAVDPSEGQKAREQAERDLAATRRQTPYYAQLAAELRDIRERNHLAETFQRLATKGR